MQIIVKIFLKDIEYFERVKEKKGEGHKNSLYKINS